MIAERQFGDITVKLVVGDVTDMEIEAFVYYASDDLKLGSGYGNAISVRGGASIREELQKLGSLESTQAVATAAGTMKSRFIIHANGPKFQEPDTETKLHRTVTNALKCAAKKNVLQLAFPMMGSGFYGIPLDICARQMLSAFEEYSRTANTIKEIIVCALDSREARPFKDILGGWKPK